MGMMDPTLVEALGYMQRAIACPDDVKARIAALRVPADDVTGTRMNTNWRSGPSRGWSHSRPSWQQGQGQGQGQGPKRPYIDRALAPRFGNKARADVTTEERMMDRIRDKMNKFSSTTFDATKTWLSQLLDSGETDFLTDFITLVFEKAAAEQTFCALYARLITELCAGFPHLKSELQRIFGEFMDIFVEAAEEPDVAAAEYKAFVALRERRRFRRGYAAFVGEIAKLRILTADDVIKTCDIILAQLMVRKALAGAGVLCEEYADCLTTLMKSCSALIRDSSGPLIVKVREAMVRDQSPSLTNKARFALMDITDMF